AHHGALRPARTRQARRSARRAVRDRVASRVFPCWPRCGNCLPAGGKPAGGRARDAPCARGGAAMDRFFGLTARGTTPRTELMAGFATFLTMAYVVVVNPQIMAAAGIDPGAA